MAHKHMTRSQERTSEVERPERREASSSLLHPVDTLRGLVDRMESFIERPFELFSGVEPKFDIEQTPKELVISAKLPGYGKEDVTVDLTEDSLTIRGCRTSEKKGRKHGAYSEEREESTFVRSMSLPDSVKTEGAKASIKDGKLEIRLPRVKEASIKRLAVD